MPFINVTDVVMNEEANELKEAYNSNLKIKAAIDQFDNECRLRRELTEARKQKNITQMQLKEMTGLTQQVISRIESNTEISPSLKNLMIYANAIGYELSLQPKKV
ncbi:MAG: helix-turn-helix domain-containing protein [Oscillospiraceae bacterium]|nr:helix-turn-helix domain-containing protein [Oscillospiraceae bacterium]